jgi:hypothetical protein
MFRPYEPRGPPRIGRPAQVVRSRYLGLAGEAEANGFGGGLGSAPDAELAQDRRDVVIDRAFGENEPARNLGIPETLRHQREHLELARCQVRRVRLGRRSRPARHRTRAALPQAARDYGRAGLGAEILELVERAAKCRLVVGLSERERRLVGATRGLPCRRGAAPVAPEL